MIHLVDYSPNSLQFNTSWWFNFTANPPHTTTLHLVKCKHLPCGIKVALYIAVSYPTALQRVTPLRQSQDYANGGITTIVFRKWRWLFNNIQVTSVYTVLECKPQTGELLILNIGHCVLFCGLEVTIDLWCGKQSEKRERALYSNHTWSEVDMVAVWERATLYSSHTPLDLVSGGPLRLTWWLCCCPLVFWR